MTWLQKTVCLILAITTYVASGVGASEAFAQGAPGEVNIYSSRHYSSDREIYDGFEAKTGILVNLLEGKGDELLERLKIEGRNSPADVYLTVDAGNLWRADQAGVLQAVQSEILTAKIPAHLRHPEGHWFGFSTRARVIFYNKETVDPATVDTYDALADPAWKGKVCVRSSGNIYNLSLLSALIAHLGEEKAAAWTDGVVANFGRRPQGGDRDQIRAVASGECAVAIGNHYYYVRLQTSQVTADRDVASKVGLLFPNQETTGTHVNIGGGAVAAHAPNRDNAVKLLEYLASSEAQGYFAGGNYEYPAVADVTPGKELQALGPFKSDTLNVSVLGENQPRAQILFDRAGWP